jgi:hypothetical protein
VSRGSDPDHESPRPPLRDRLNDAVKGQLRDEELGRSMIDLLDCPGRPIVVDANRLRGEIRTLAQSGHDTARS